MIRVEKNGQPDMTFTRSAPTDGGWHHYSILLADAADHSAGVMTIFVDGNAGSPLFYGSSVFPPGNDVPAQVGASPTGTKYVPADIDNLLIFGHSVPGCQISRQVDLKESPPDLTPCP